VWWQGGGHRAERRGRERSPEGSEGKSLLALDLLSEGADTVLNKHEPLLPLAKLDHLDIDIGAECFAPHLQLDEPGAGFVGTHWSTSAGSMSSSAHSRMNSSSDNGRSPER